MLPQLKLTEDEKKEGAFLPKWLTIRKITLDAHGRDAILGSQREIVRGTLKSIPGKTLFIDNPIPYRNETVKGIREAHLTGPEHPVFTPSFPIGEEQYSLEDQHYNKEGHKKFAEELAVFLMARGLLPCKGAQ